MAELKEQLWSETFAAATHVVRAPTALNATAIVAAIGLAGNSSVVAVDDVQTAIWLFVAGCGFGLLTGFFYWLGTRCNAEAWSYNDFAIERHALGDYINADIYRNKIPLRQRIGLLGYSGTLLLFIASSSCFLWGAWTVADAFTASAPGPVSGELEKPPVIIINGD